MRRAAEQRRHAVTALAGCSGFSPNAGSAFLSARAADPLAAAVAHISNAAGTLADLLGEDRPLLHDTVGHLEVITQSLIHDLPTLDDVLRKLPGEQRQWVYRQDLAELVLAESEQLHQPGRPLGAQLRASRSVVIRPRPR